MNLPQQAQQIATDMLQGTSCQSDPVIFLTGLLAGVLAGLAIAALIFLAYIKVKYR